MKSSPRSSVPAASSQPQRQKDQLKAVDPKQSVAARNPHREQLVMDVLTVRPKDRQSAQPAPQHREQSIAQWQRQHK